MSNADLETFEIPWTDEGPLTFYVDADDGCICLECPDFDFALAIQPDDWLACVEWIAKQRTKGMS